MRRFCSFLPFIFLVLSAAGSPVSSCQTKSLAAYETSSSPACLQGLFEYSGFILTSFGISQSNLTRLDVANAITVTPNGAGFFFSSPLFQVTAGQSANFGIHYEYFIDPAPIVVGAVLELDPPFGNVQVKQVYGLPDPCPTSSVELNVTPSKTVDTKGFGCGVFQGTVDTSISENGPAGFDQVGGRLLFSTGTGTGTGTVPEPSTLILAGIGLAFLCLWKGRFGNRRSRSL